MSFDRYRVQSLIELDIGCTDVKKWGSYKHVFTEYEITESRRRKILIELKEDTADMYFKAVFSLVDAINSLFNGRHSWALIKLYYSVFFFLRCSLATKNIAIIKNNGIYTLDLTIGSKPQRWDNKKHMGEKVTGDHKTTINIFSSLFSETDILLTNTINGKSVYNWFMEIRNQVNYRERSFTEPNNKYFVANIFEKSKFKNQIETYLKDDLYVYCFDENHCALAIPLKLATHVRQQLFDFIDFEPISPEKKVEIEKLVNEIKLNELQEFKKIYEFERG